MLYATANHFYCWWHKSSNYW